MDNTAIHFLNGKLIKESELVVSIRDLGFMRGFAVFDFLVTYNGQKPFMLDRHIERFLRSAALIGLALPWSKEELRSWVTDTLAANKDGKEKAIKMVASGGPAHGLVPEGEPTIAILVDTLRPYPADCYVNGVGITMDKFRRYTPEAKSNDYIEGVKAAQIAAKIGADEPIYYDETQVYEGARSNVFAVIDGRITTPKSNILEGVTRDVLLELLPAQGFSVIKRDFTVEEFGAATEVFLAASNKEIMPVTKIDGKPVGDGSVGPVSKEVMRIFKEFTLSDKW